MSWSVCVRVTGPCLEEWSLGVHPSDVTLGRLVLDDLMPPSIPVLRPGHLALRHAVPVVVYQAVLHLTPAVCCLLQPIVHDALPAPPATQHLAHRFVILTRNAPLICHTGKTCPS